MHTQPDLNMKDLN